MDTALPKPRLIPFAVPWSVSPSTPFLVLHITEQASDPSYAQFVANDKLAAAGQSSSRTSGKKVEIWQPSDWSGPDISDSRSEYRLVRIEFKGVRYASMRAAYSDREVVDRSAFDWSGISPYYDGGDVGTFLAAFDQKWRDSGICPDPRIYEVEQLGPVGLKTHQQYLILGHDAYIEVVARSASIVLGKPL
jgi:hypothetical protein